MVDYDAHQWGRHLLAIRGTMLREIVGRVLLVGVWSLVVLGVHRFVHPVDVPATAHTLVGLSLGLLLVFRTNASYDRFWEGRKLWGGIVNDTRNLARKATAWMPQESARVEEIIRWTIAFPYGAMHALRGQKGLGPIAAELPKAEADATVAAQHVPLAIARKISICIDEARRAGRLTDFQQITLEQDVELLIDHMGGCERIYRTPLPFAYVVHLRRALVLYCYSLPFALVDNFGWLSALVALLVAYTFYGIEEIGVEIEDPFGQDDNDLPLERICATIEANLRALLGSKT